VDARGVVFTAPQQVEVWDIEIPEPGPEDLFIRVLYSGISVGTEGWNLLGKYKGVTYPLVTGYQHCGVVEKVGAAVSRFEEGDLVFSRHTRLLGDIRPMWAGHVSHATVSADLVIPVPDGVGADAASLGVMPGVPWRGIQETRIFNGDLVVVVGLGLVGQCAAQLARIQGAKVIGLDVLEKRLALAGEHSADLVLNSREDDVDGCIKALKEAGADVIIDTSANQEVVNESFEWIRRGGRYCLQGYYPDMTCLDLYLPHVKQLTFYNPTNCEGIDTMFSFIARGMLDVGSLITHCFEAEDAPEPFELMIQRPEEVLAMVLHWSDR
jgi:2-desacetyl-2-hydroxyethyl bacteriochlorophyllide A dehydrogenase